MVQISVQINTLLSSVFVPAVTQNAGAEASNSLHDLYIIRIWIAPRENVLSCEDVLNEPEYIKTNEHAR